INVAVDEHQVRPTIVVNIDELRAKAEGAYRGRADTGRGAGVLEETTQVVVERVRFPGEGRDGEVETAVSIVIRAVDAHPCLSLPPLTKRRAGFEIHVSKPAAALVLHQVPRRAVIPDVEVGPAVTVEVAEA